MKNYTITLNSAQLELLATFVNEAVKSVGLTSVRKAVLALDILESAVEVETEQSKED